jgi:hypothetical protein
MVNISVYLWKCVFSHLYGVIKAVVLVTGAMELLGMKLVISVLVLRRELRVTGGRESVKNGVILFREFVVHLYIF